MTYETENMEFKVQFTEELYKEVIAFANTDGGVICVGIDNDGNVVGLTDVDKEYTRITNGIRDAILPDVMMCVRFTIQENRVVRITVNEGSSKPYYLKSKGLKPSGVFVRQGTSSVPASPEQIRRMIKESDGDVFEELRSLNQDLTFREAETAFGHFGIEFGENKYRALGLTRQQDNLFTNLAWLLSDQCRHTVKVAVFGDEMNTVFKDSKEFGGSLLKQLEDTYQYLMLCNNTHSAIHGLVRTDKKDYPEEAVREVLLNALVHRDYGYSGSIIININDKQIEVISLGGLLPGLSAEDIRLGISQPRNRNLAEVFHRLRLIESYGTGIRRIYKLYEACPEQPKIEITPNVFKITLPNMNKMLVGREQPLTPQMQCVLAYAAEHEYITDSDIAALLQVKSTRAYTITKQLRDKGLLTVTGRGNGKKYFLAK